MLRMPCALSLRCPKYSRQGNWSASLRMHFLIHGVGTSGDVLPFIGIGRSLRRRGHQVTLMANDYFRNAAEQAGLDFHSLGPVEEYLAVIRDPALWHPSQS